MKNNRILNYFLLILGIGLALVGGLLLINGTTKTLSTFSAVCFGIGLGLFGMSFGNIIVMIVNSKNPDMVRKMEREGNDERAVTIRNLAKVRSYDVMSNIFPVLILIFLLINRDLVFILLLVGAYIVRTTFYVIFLSKYSKQL